MAPRTETPVGEVIAELEQVIPRSMMHEGADQVIEDYPELRDRAANTLPPQQCPGLSVALIRQGRCVWSAGYGIESVRTGDAVATDTMFLGWSLTKPMAAYAALTV